MKTSSICLLGAHCAKGIVIGMEDTGRWQVVLTHERLFLWKSVQSHMDCAIREDLCFGESEKVLK